MIFVDVGAHEGQTLEEAVRYDFDLVYALEPMPAQFERLTERFRGQAAIFSAGLGAETGTFPLYGANEDMEASIYPDKEDVDAAVVTECEFIEASEFFRDLPEGVFLKLNCEGAEVSILDNLVDSGEIEKVESLLVDFDVGRIPGMAAEELRILERLLSVDVVTSESVVPRGRERRIEGTYRYSRGDEIMCWLKSRGVAER